MFKAPFSFSGRIRRTEFWFTAIINNIVFYSVIGIINASRGEMMFLLFLFIPLFFFGLAQSVKRSHDVGNSGWYVLIPFYGFFLLFAAGQVGSNRYGEDPKSINHLNVSNTSQSSSTQSQNSSIIYNGGHNADYGNTNNNYNTNSQYSNQETSGGEFFGNNPYVKN